MPDLRERLAEIMADAWPLTDMPPWEGSTEPERDSWRDVADALLASEEWQGMVRGLMAVRGLIEESHGVAGLHLNGDVAPWEELRDGGRFEDWLRDFDAALARLDAARNRTC